MKQLKIIAALVAGLFTFSSANAGEMSVTGSMHATYQSNSENETGNPLGMNTDLTFTGITEVLDGTAVTWTMGTDGTFVGDASADHKIVFASPYGNFKIGNSGDSANAIDDITLFLPHEMIILLSQTNFSVNRFSEIGVNFGGIKFQNGFNLIS